MKTSVIECAKTFDSDSSMKRLFDETLEKLKVFRAEYPFAEDPDSIEALKPQAIFKVDRGQIGEFFHCIEYYLKPLGHLALYSNVYRCIRSQLEDFKELLHIVVDQEKSLAEKVDAPWIKIKGLGRDSHLAKKIIFCFNYEKGTVIPIFSTSHLEHFLDKILEEPWLPLKYENMSLGQKYEALTNEILEAKESSPITKDWDVTYFSRFLYETYTSKKISETERKKRLARALLDQQRKFCELVNLLNELKSKNKITAEELRSYRDRWDRNPQDRKTIDDTLRALRT